MLIVINKMLMYISFISKLNVRYVFKLYVLINNLLVMLFINCEK